MAWAFSLAVARLFVLLGVRRRRTTRQGAIAGSLGIPISLVLRMLLG